MANAANTSIPDSMSLRGLAGVSRVSASTVRQQPCYNEAKQKTDQKSEQ